MLDDDYLLLGLDALSCAHERDYFVDGHLAASVMAAYFLCRDNSLDERTQDAIKWHIDGDLRRDMLVRRVPDEPADPALLPKLVETLSAGAADLRQAGHNAIFAAAALKAFRQRPDTITPFRVHGVSALVASFVTTQNAPVYDQDGVPDVADEEAFIGFIFREFLRTAEHYAGRGHGWTGHLVTFGHAVIELWRLGYADVACRVREAFRIYVANVRRGPRDFDRAVPDRRPTGATPLDYAYWAARRSVRPGLGHAFKYAYSFYHLLPSLKGSALGERCLAQSYKIF